MTSTLFVAIVHRAVGRTVPVRLRRERKERRVGSGTRCGRVDGAVRVGARGGAVVDWMVGMGVAVHTDVGRTMCLGVRLGRLAEDVVAVAVGSRVLLM